MKLDTLREMAIQEGQHKLVEASVALTGAKPERCAE
jgi:hypothetical protein